VWLVDGDASWLSAVGRTVFDNHDALISPAVVLELQILWEKKRIKWQASAVIEELTAHFGAEICRLSFSLIVEAALKEHWTRDPMDRLIVAHAKANDSPLLTADAEILKHYRKAVC
jgi:PIN domain nuclease of toxin-antitoxin system